MKLYAVRTAEGPVEDRVAVGIFYAADVWHLAVDMVDALLDPSECEFKEITGPFAITAREDKPFPPHMTVGASVKDEGDWEAQQCPLEIRQDLINGKPLADDGWRSLVDAMEMA